MALQFLCSVYFAAMVRYVVFLRFSFLFLPVLDYRCDTGTVAIIYREKYFPNTRWYRAIEHFVEFTPIVELDVKFSLYRIV